MRIRDRPGSAESRQLGSAFAGAIVTTGGGVALVAVGTDVDPLVQVTLQCVWSGLFLWAVVQRRGLWQRMDGTPLRRLGTANHLTFARIYLLPALVFLIVGSAWTVAVLFFVLLALTDIADGMLARRAANVTKLGYVLDPVGDILFNLGVTVALAARGALPPWVGALAFLRYSILLVGGFALLLRRGELRVGPTQLGKMTGLVIGATLFLILLDLASSPGLGPMAKVASTVLGIAFGIGVVQAAQLGWDRLRRPEHGSGPRYRRGGQLWSSPPGTPDDPTR